MYLYVFVFIILSVMSIYMELFSMRVARLSEQQTTAAGIMYTWHNGAYKYAKAHFNDGNSADTCLIGGPNPITGTVKCKDGGGSSIDYFNVVSEGTGSSKVQYVPDGFNLTYISTQYPSYVHKDGTQRFIVTYVMNGGTAMGLDAGQTVSQLVRSKIPPVSFGSVLDLKCDGSAGRRIKMRDFNDWGGTNVDYCYDVPSTINIGSIGILSHL